MSKINEQVKKSTGHEEEESEMDKLHSKERESHHKLVKEHFEEIHRKEAEPRETHHYQHGVESHTSEGRLVSGNEEGEVKHTWLDY